MIHGKLPHPWTAFVGREREQASLRRLLVRARLVTVVGLSGVGKTRLARQVAAELLPQFGGQVWFIPCEAFESAAAILPFLRETIGLEEGMTSEPELLARLAGQRALLFLDSAECLLPHGLPELLRSLLERTPQLSVMLTSLAPLGMAGEHLFTLRPMYPPASLNATEPLNGSRLTAAARTENRSAWQALDAVRLFELRAQQRDCEWELTPANLPSVVELCRAVDWLPLGIELAAGQLCPWTEAQLLEQLRSRGHWLDLTAPGGAERHQSLRGAIAWSWTRLPAGEQALIEMIAGLGGRLLEEALEPVTGDPAARSMAASLFRRGWMQSEEQNGRLRYQLAEAVRQFVLEQPSCRPVDLERAISFGLELVRREGAALATPRAAAAAALLHQEEPLLRRCWRWAREREEIERLCAFAESLGEQLIHELELPADAGELTQAALTAARARGKPAYPLAWIDGAVAARRGDAETAIVRLRECQDEAAPAFVRAMAGKELGQLQLRQGQALAGCETLQQAVRSLLELDRPVEAAWTRRALAQAYAHLGDREGAQRLLEDLRLQFVEWELPTGQAASCCDLACLAADREQWEAAETWGEEAARFYQQLGHGAGWATATLQQARARSRLDRLPEAKALYEAALAALRASGDAEALCCGLLQMAGEPHAAVRPIEPGAACRECISLARKCGLRSLLARALQELASLYAERGHRERALALAEEAVQVARATTETQLIQGSLDLLGRMQHVPHRAPLSAGPFPPPSVPIQVEAVVVRELAAPAHLHPQPLGIAGHPPRSAAARSLSRPAETAGGGADGVTVRIQLLGGLRLFLGEEEVPLLEWWAKAKKLFAYLVIHRRRPVSRDTLLEEFWPDGDQQRAIHSLQTTLSFLRRSLRSLPGGPRLAERLIVARDGNYLFDSEGHCESDLQLFEEHFQEAARLKASSQAEEAADHWQAADRLYLGDLLPEFPYEDWCASPRERLRSQYLDLLLNLGTYYRQAQRPREALRTAERMFVIDGCDERAHRMAMRCHFQMGRPVDALRQYERCCQILERELRVPPSKPTRELRDQIRRRMDGESAPGVEGSSDSLAAGAS